MTAGVGTSAPGGVERSRAVAQEPGRPRYIAYRLGGERVVSPTGEVAEVLPLPQLAFVPRTRPWLAGVAQVRGRIVPVTDLSLFLGGAPARVGRAARVLLANSTELLCGLLVDEVFGVREAEAERIARPHAAWLGVRARTHVVVEEDEWPLVLLAETLADPRFEDAAAR